MSTTEEFLYLDTSAALAHLLSETDRPPEEMWRHALVSSRLLEYEVRTRLRALGLASSHGAMAEQLLQHVALLELVRPVLGPPENDLPASLRTLDVLHLSTMFFLREQGADPRLASYDRRLNGAAERSGFLLYPLRR